MLYFGFHIQSQWKALDFVTENKYLMSTLANKNTFFPAEKSKILKQFQLDFWRDHFIFVNICSVKLDFSLCFSEKLFFW